MSWHKRITEAREDSGLNKSGLAKAANVSPPTVTDWESGETKEITGENLLRVAFVLGVNPEWTMFGSGRKKRCTCGVDFQVGGG